jgi:diguanylate cyclase (GGDEF)-like protein
MGMNGFSRSRFKYLEYLLIAITAFFSTYTYSLEVEEIPQYFYQDKPAEQLLLTEAESIWIKQHPKVSVAIRNGWMPVEFQLENQKHKGVSVDYLERISQLTGLKFSIIDYHDNVTQEEVELITGIRGKDYAPAGFNLLELPYLDTPNVIYVASANQLYQSEINLNQLANKTVAVFRTGPVAKKLKALVPGIKIQLVDIADEAFEYLASGQVDAYVGNELVLDYHQDFHKIKFIRKAGTTPITSKVFMAVSDRDPILLSILNKATLHIGTNPQDILDTYRRTPENTVTKYLISAISFFVVLLLFQLIKVYQSSKRQAQEAEQKIWFQANHDFLTNLPNRYLLKNKLHEALEQSAENQNRIGVMIIDLDNFKEINDTAGHAIGDEVLIEVAERIKSIIKPPHIISRFGGDEFLIVLQNNPDEETLGAICTSLIRQMEVPVQVQQKTFVVSMSIGASLSPTNSDNADELIMFADEAMYQAKKTGKNKYSLFTEYMHAIFTQKTHLGNQLRYAVERDQLFLQYHPIFNLKTMHCEKVEALLRWQHPELGLISPETFIRIAEENGCISDLGNWVFHQVLKDFPALRKRFGDIQVCINISPIQFTQSESIHTFLSTLNSLNIPGEYICFEITEGLLLEPSNHVIENLNKISEAGIKLAIDDFGTGYSSLAYLNKYKVDYVKIDKSFIKNLTQNLNDQALCRTIIYMGNQLHMKLIGEGVETLEQEMVLKEMQCHYSQGYFRARPTNIEHL